MSEIRGRWLFLPLCLVIGVSFLYYLVQYSQRYLSEEHYKNSTQQALDKHVELTTISEHLGDERILKHTSEHPDGDIWLSFWASSCSPCLKKLPDLKSSKKTLLVPINMDSPEQLEVAEKVFRQLAPKALPFLHDGMRVLAKSFDIEFLPTHIYIDANGVVKDIRIGNDAPAR